MTEDVQRSQFVFICSLPRSGSTLLQAILSTAGDIVGVGEIMETADRNRGTITRPLKSVCSCGESVKSCSFWGDNFLEQLRMHTDDAALYEAIVDRFADTYGSKTLVDNSKALARLEQIYRSTLQRHNAKVLFLVRDLRGWITSMQARDQRWLHAHYVRLARLWRLKNMAFEHILKRMGVSTLYVSYDRLALEPEQQLPRIANFIGTKSSLSTDLYASHFHELTGSTSFVERLQNGGRLSYDYRWMTRSTAASAWNALLRAETKYNDRIWDLSR